ncbi:hypothetical protein KSD_72620 [Ktedonobacter sp. SOSP1-85]|uniref:hypothetical protein n=1 Tax=Ktedonobacter sp. SOSP1-85 TaxID=2778367 RepID=UPI0019163C43|nr:hypothetical protein [Ktedonobacter sp. SOSP1-85]GHO79491.1 hypothetical protein KSD_72620 [Ktedonobacter sp. SOSP1-85]
MRSVVNERWIRDGRGKNQEDTFFRQQIVSQKLSQRLDAERQDRLAHCTRSDRGGMGLLALTFQIG